MTIVTKARVVFAFLQGVAISMLAMAFGRRSTNSTVYETVLVTAGVLCIVIALSVSYRYKLNDPATVAGQPRGMLLLTRYVSLCAGVVLTTFILGTF